MSTQCELVAHWLTQRPTPDTASSPPDELIVHVQNCRRCRGAVLLLVTNLTFPGAGPPDLACAVVEADIPAFVDYQRLHGSSAAALQFPNVWWHCLVCPECAALCAALVELGAAPDAPWQQPLQPAAPATIPRLHLSFRTLLVRQLLAVEQRMGVSWGEPHTDILIAEQASDVRTLRLYIQRQASASLALVVTTEPVMAGVAELVLASETYTSALDSKGKAFFGGLHTALFAVDAEAGVSVMPNA